MLLRSVTKHVKEQNWFAVALDFVIVVSYMLGNQPLRLAPEGEETTQSCQSTISGITM